MAIALVHSITLLARVHLLDPMDVHPAGVTVTRREKCVHEGRKEEEEEVKMIIVGVWVPVFMPSLPLPCEIQCKHIVVVQMR